LIGTTLLYKTLYDGSLLVTRKNPNILTSAQLRPLEGTEPYYFDENDFNIAFKVDAIGSSEGLNPAKINVVAKQVTLERQDGMGLRLASEIPVSFGDCDHSKHFKDMTDHDFSHLDGHTCLNLKDVHLH